MAVIAFPAVAPIGCRTQADTAIDAANAGLGQQGLYSALMPPSQVS